MNFFKLMSLLIWTFTFRSNKTSTGNLAKMQSESLSHPFSSISKNILPKSAESIGDQTPINHQSQLQLPTPVPAKGPVLTAQTEKKQESFKEQVLRAKKNREEAEFEYKKVYQQLKVSKLRYLTTHHVYKLLLQEYVKMNNRCNFVSIFFPCFSNSLMLLL